MSTAYVHPLLSIELLLKLEEQDQECPDPLLSVNDPAFVVETVVWLARILNKEGSDVVCPTRYSKNPSQS